MVLASVMHRWSTLLPLCCWLALVGGARKPCVFATARDRPRPALPTHDCGCQHSRRGAYDASAFVRGRTAAPAAVTRLHLSPCSHMHAARFPARAIASWSRVLAISGEVTMPRALAALRTAAPSQAWTGRAPLRSSRGLTRTTSAGAPLASPLHSLEHMPWRWEDLCSWVHGDNAAARAVQ